MRSHRNETWRSPPRAPQHPHTASVLIVDDETVIRSTLSALFAPRFELLTAEHGASALRMIEADHAESIALVVSAVRMPWMNGVELHRALAARSHRLATSFAWMTDETISAAHERYVSSTGMPRLEKPFRLERLEQLIEDVTSVSGIVQVR